MKKMRVIALLSVMALSLAACGSAAEKAAPGSEGGTGTPVAEPVKEGGSEASSIGGETKGEDAGGAGTEWKWDNKIEIMVPAAAGKFDVDMWGELKAVSGCVQAEGVIFANPKTPFSNLEEMISYAKEHPGQVSIAIDAPTGISAAVPTGNRRRK